MAIFPDLWLVVQDLMEHKPVILKEVLEYLAPKPGENFVDCTINGGGHALAILKLIWPRGRLLGIDRDEEILKKLKVKSMPRTETKFLVRGEKHAPYRNEVSGSGLKVNERLILVCDSFVNLKKIVEEHNFKPVDGVLLDLGLSSWHLEESGRGFTFKKNEPLDMRFSVEKPTKSGAEISTRLLVGKITAREIVNEWPEEELVGIFQEYGEERFARRIAREIVKERKFKPIKTTFELVEVIRRATPPKYHYGRLPFATRTFQALRIAVNGELESLKKVLPQALELLEKEGRLAAISFHSLEDRIVKNFLRDKSKEGRLKILTKKPVTPSQEEIKSNPRARSAKLRAAVIT